MTDSKGLVQICAALAEHALMEHDWKNAERFALQAERLYLYAHNIGNVYDGRAIPKHMNQKINFEVNSKGRKITIPALDMDELYNDLIETCIITNTTRCIYNTDQLPQAIAEIFIEIAYRATDVRKAQSFLLKAEHLWPSEKAKKHLSELNTLPFIKTSISKSMAELLNDLIEKKIAVGENGIAQKYASISYKLAPEQRIENLIQCLRDHFKTDIYMEQAINANTSEDSLTLKKHKANDKIDETNEDEFLVKAGTFSANCNEKTSYDEFGRFNPRAPQPRISKTSSVKSNKSSFCYKVENNIYCPYANTSRNVAYDHMYHMPAKKDVRTLKDGRTESDYYIDEFQKTSNFEPLYRAPNFVVKDFTPTYIPSKEQQCVLERISTAKNDLEILGIREEATLREIKTAVNNLLLLLHPDKYPDPVATEAYRKVREVAERLKSLHPHNKTTTGIIGQHFAITCQPTKSTKFMF